MSAAKSDPPRVPQGRHGLPREVIDDVQRQRLMASMASVVVDQGYAATSVADVIAAAGMSRTTFYQLFLDKEDCFLATYSSGVHLFAEATTQARAAEAGSWRERAERTFAALLASFAAHPDLAHICMVDVLGAGPNAVARYRRSSAAFFTMIERGAAEDPGHPTAPRVVIEALVGGVVSLVRTRINDGGTGALPELLPHLTTFYVATFLGYEELRRSQEATP